MKYISQRPDSREVEHRIAHQIDSLIAILEIDATADDLQLVESLLQVGVGRRTAMRLVVLVPSAFGRDMVSRLGVRLDPNVEISTGEGFGRAVRRLDSFAEFRVARSLIPNLRGTTAYVHLATRSAEAHAVEALRLQGVTDLANVALTPSLIGWDILSATQ